MVHYLILSYDYPPIAERGLPAARLYSQIAPNNPHALHMPSHIFTRRGMWQDSIDSNLRSAAAAKAENNGQEQAHAMDYLVHAYLQLGEDADAKRVVAESASISVNPAIFIGHYALAAMPARYAVERRAWGEAIMLQPRPTSFMFPDAITHFARGLGYARTGDTASARKEESRLAQLRDGLADQKIRIGRTRRRSRGSLSTAGLRWRKARRTTHSSRCKRQRTWRIRWKNTSSHPVR